ncbi:MAG: UDP-N-acetylmuramate dehydrogenase [Clostridia bacterium]|nr:UDP-N-acetylmuramate dehydrogenase [Clostridia bacterium]
MNYDAFKEFCSLVGINCKINEPMSEHTSFKIGGPADFFVLPKNKSELSAVLEKLKELSIPFFVLGKGSNLLVSDKGIEGAVICLLGMDEIEVSGNCIKADVGATLASICVTAAKNNLSGLEFAYGIPGCVGGALYMNAGAYGGEMSQVVKSAEYITADGRTGSLELSEMYLGYRTSVFKKSDMIITSVTFELDTGKQEEIRALMDDYLCRRRSKQPLEFPSAGSTFKRPEGHFAGALIEKNQLKGTKIGGAMVSEKHAGFIINCGNAKCEDVRKLIAHVADTVFKSDNVILEPEVIFVGRE